MLWKRACGTCTTPEVTSQGVARWALPVDYTINLTSTWSSTTALNRSCDSHRRQSMFSTHDGW